MPGKDPQEIIKHLLVTEDAFNKMQNENTLVCVVDRKANKKQIKKAVEQLFGVEVVKVNTMISQFGIKKAFVRLTQDYDALDVATKLGVF